LTAIGAPTQALWARLGWIYTVLVVAFGFGLWKSAYRNRAVRIVGDLILAYASLGLLWPFAAMHQREVLAAGGGTWSDTAHVVLGGVTVFLMFLAIGFGATAFGKRFRLLFDCQHRRPPRVRRVDIPRGTRRAGEPANAVDRVVGTHQHQRISALGRGAGDHAVADRDSEVIRGGRCVLKASFAALLDALGIGQADVIGLSAGATSALQLALRHPEKVKHLAVLVGNLPGSPTAVVQPSWTMRVNRQFVMWALRTFAPSTTARLVAAVPREFAMSGEDARIVNEVIDSLFPMSPAGYNFDLFVSNTDVTNYNLEAISVPTLIAHTKDDQLASHEASQRAAERIPGARFVSIESGGHLMLGLQKKRGDELADFFAGRMDRRAERVAS
jgi:pimeloyl-ACP methyl ester carboxylesterase